MENQQEMGNGIKAYPLKPFTQLKPHDYKCTQATQEHDEMTNSGTECMERTAHEYKVHLIMTIKAHHLKTGSKIKSKIKCFITTYA